MPAPDLIWKPLAPLMHLIESWQGVMEFCTLYLPGCVAGAVWLASLVLMGVVLATRETPASAPEPASMREATPA